MRPSQPETRDVDPEIGRIVEWANSTAPGYPRMLPGTAEVRPGPGVSLAGEILGAVLYASIFLGSFRFLEALPF